MPGPTFGVPDWARGGIADANVVIFNGTIPLNNTIGIQADCSRWKSMFLACNAMTQPFDLYLQWWTDSTTTVLCGAQTIFNGNKAFIACQIQHMGPYLTIVGVNNSSTGTATITVTFSSRECSGVRTSRFSLWAIPSTLVGPGGNVTLNISTITSGAATVTGFSDGPSGVLQLQAVSEVWGRTTIVQPGLTATQNLSQNIYVPLASIVLVLFNEDSAEHNMSASLNFDPRS